MLLYAVPLPREVCFESPGRGVAGIHALCEQTSARIVQTPLSAVWRSGIPEVAQKGRGFKGKGKSRKQPNTRYSLLDV